MLPVGGDVDDAELNLWNNRSILKTPDKFRLKLNWPRVAHGDDSSLVLPRQHGMHGMPPPAGVSAL